MAEVTIVCCYNDPNQYELLLASIKRQNLAIAVIGMDNTQNRFRSCAEAYNRSMELLQTEFVIFAHQDIAFLRDDTVSSFLKQMKAVDTYDIVGAAGRCEKGGKVFTNIRQSREQSNAVPEKLVVCDCVDECFFGGYTECFRRYPFDEKICCGWHLYAVDRSLAARARGNRVYAYSIPLIHKSKGKMDASYHRQFYALSRKYAKQIDYLNTTCAYAGTRFPQREIAYLKRVISMKLGRY